MLCQIEYLSHGWHFIHFCRTFRCFDSWGIVYVFSFRVVHFNGEICKRKVDFLVNTYIYAIYVKHGKWMASMKNCNPLLYENSTLAQLPNVIFQWQGTFRNKGIVWADQVFKKQQDTNISNHPAFRNCQILKPFPTHLSKNHSPLSSQASREMPLLIDIIIQVGSDIALWYPGVYSRWWSGVLLKTWGGGAMQQNSLPADEWWVAVLRFPYVWGSEGVNLVESEGGPRHVLQLHLQSKLVILCRVMRGKVKGPATRGGWQRVRLPKPVLLVGSAVSTLHF